MPKLLGRMLSCAAIACSAILPQAQAAVIDFEGIPAPTILFAGDSVDQEGFRITAGGSFGTVDNILGLGDLAPTGNDSQFYSGFNDTFVTINRPDGLLFTLNSFDAAFIPPVVQGAGVDPGAIYLRVTAGDGSVRLYFGEFSPSDLDGKSA